MCNVKWAGTPCGYTRSRATRKRVDRWASAPARQTMAEKKDARYWLGVIGVFAACLAVMTWAALISV